MKNLTIQDVFEPYYAGRRRFPAPREGGQPTETDGTTARKPVPDRSLTDAEASPKTDSATEH